MNPDERLAVAPFRSSVSVRRLWSQVSESQVTRSGRITDKDVGDLSLIPKYPTPYNVQNPPSFVGGIPAPQTMVGSRAIDRILLQNEMHDLEARFPALERENVRLKSQLRAALRINVEMAQAMSKAMSVSANE